MSTPTKSLTQRLKQLPFAVLATLVLVVSLLVGTGMGFGFRAAHQAMADASNCLAVYKNLWDMYRANPRALTPDVAMEETKQLNDLRATKYISPLMRQITTTILSLDTSYLLHTDVERNAAPLTATQVNRTAALLAENRTNLRHLCGK